MEFSPIFDGENLDTQKRSANDLIRELNKVGHKRTKAPTLGDLMTEENIMKCLNFLIVFFGALFIFMCVWAFTPIIYFLPPVLSTISISAVFDLIAYGAFTILLGVYGYCFLWKSNRGQSQALLAQMVQVRPPCLMQ